MKNIDYWKRLWASVNYNDQKDKIIDAAVKTADSETLKWFWDSVDYNDQRDKIINAAVARADSETLEWFLGVCIYNDQKDKILDALLKRGDEKRGSQPHQKTTHTQEQTKPNKYNCFICHASEDKEPFVKGLASSLDSKGVSVWYDEYTIYMGDSLLSKINHGINNSRYGVVVFSKNFFQKKWPLQELNGLFAKEMYGEKVILPILHEITIEELIKQLPIFGDRYAVPSNKGIDFVVDKIIEAITQSCV